MGGVKRLPDGGSEKETTDAEEGADTDSEPSEPEPTEREPEPAPRAEASEAEPSLPLAAGAFAGALAYVLGYLITYAITNGPIRNSVIGNIAGNDVWRAVGWVYYNAHYVDTVGTLDTFGFSVNRAANLISLVDQFPIWLFAVPPILLLGTGALMGHRSARNQDVEFAAKTGLTLVPGYLALALVGAFVFRLTTDNVAIGPEPVTAVFLGGFVYPILLGVIGAVVITRF